MMSSVAGVAVIAVAHPDVLATVAAIATIVTPMLG